MIEHSKIRALPLATGALFLFWASPSGAQDAQPAPAPAFVLVGPERAPTPLLRFDLKGAAIEAGAQVDLRTEGFTTLPVDQRGTAYDIDIALAPRLRVGLRADSGGLLKKVALHLEYEHDLITGYWTASEPIRGAALPDADPIDQELRKLYLRLSLGTYLHVGAGVMTNHFGLGLVANDGAQGDSTPGSARFADSRGGDRVIRGFVASGPLTAAGIVGTIAVDKPWTDDVLLPGDSAIQVSGALSAGYKKPWGAGVFIVHRRQEASYGGHTEATAFDLTARLRRDVGSLKLSLEGEAALIVGETTLGATPEIPSHDVLQFGAAARATLGTDACGGALDVLFASGDGNPDDHTQRAFKADPNAEMGLLLYRYVLAAQTGRGAATAGDPSLVGVPSQGLERVPTRGSPTNTLAFFPRAYIRPIDGLKIYGGPLIAFSPEPLYDPLNTRVAGGVVRNALGGAPSGFLGVEVDVGVRFRMLVRGSSLMIGVEGGALAPGGAFVNAGGDTMASVLGARALLQYRL